MCIRDRYNRTLSASSNRSRKEYNSPSSSYHNSNRPRPWTAGDERRIIGKPPNVDEELSKNKDHINDLLSDGAKKARLIAKEKILEIREAVGLSKIL